MVLSRCTLLLLLAAVVALLVVAVLVSGAVSARKRGYDGSPPQSFASAQVEAPQQRQPCASGCAQAQAPPSLRQHLGQRFPSRTSREGSEVLRPEPSAVRPNRDPAGDLATAPMTKAAPRYATVSSEKAALSKRGQVHDINSAQLDSLTQTNGWSGVLMVYSPSCGHCHAMMADFEKAASAAGVPFYRLNGDNNLSIMKKYQIRGYPTLYRFRGVNFTAYPPEGDKSYKGDRSYAELVRFGK